MLKRLFILLPALAGYGNLIAQNEEDVMRYAFQYLNGSARSMSMGGSGIAMGADLSSININPAGLAFYRSNQYNIGLGFDYSRTNSQYIDQTSRGNRGSLTIPQLGIVFTHINRDKGKEVKTGVINYSFGFNMNRSNSFVHRIKIDGTNLYSSMMDYFAQNANGISNSSLSSDFNSPEGLAWNGYLINNRSGSSTEYVANIPDDIIMLQRGEVRTTGRMNDFSASFGMNIKHILYLGAAITHHRLRLDYENTWEETTGSVYSPPRNFQYSSVFSSEGTALSLRLGAILRFNDYMRLGFSYQSGSRLNITDSYYWTLNSVGFSGNQTPIDLQTSIFSYIYKIQLPERISTGLTLILPKTGILNFDLESVNYNVGTLSSNDYAFSTENRSIRNNAETALNIRTGLEILSGPIRYRAGFSYLPSPWKSEYTASKKLATQLYTLGLGYKDKTGFYVDGALVFRSYTNYYTPYYLTNSSRPSYTAENKNLNTIFMINIGSNF